MKKPHLTKKTRKDKKILAGLYSQNSKNIALSEQVSQFLTEGFKPHICQCSFHQQILTIVVSSQLIASKLRYALPQLKNQLKGINIFRSLRKIRLQINQAKKQKQLTAVKISKPVYSNNSANLVLALSENINDPELQLSLQKLAQHIKK
ncbi:MAG: DciA family protein [Pseudomonadota bacterium]